MVAKNAATDENMQCVIKGLVELEKVLGCTKKCIKNQ